MRKPLLLLAISPWAQAFVTVGTDNECDYQPESLQFALMTNEEVRITNQTTYSAITIINRSVVLKGSYNTCADANVGNITANRSIITGNQTTTAVDIETTAAAGHLSQSVALERLVIRDGLTSGSNLAGGINISGNVTVTGQLITVVDNVANQFGGGIYVNGLQGAVLNLNIANINNNTASEGGGIFASQNATINIFNQTEVSHNSSTVAGGGISISSGSQLNIDDSRIQQNQSNYGAGLNCNGVGSQIDIVNGSSIYRNEAGSAGGGLAATNGCLINMKSGNDVNTAVRTNGLNLNFAELWGGAAYINNATLIVKGNEVHPADIMDNYTTDVASGRGGGIYATGENAFVNVINGRVKNNASIYGGAFYVKRGAHMTMKRSTGTCFGNQICSEIADNYSTQSGTIYLADCGTSKILQTSIHDNWANSGAVMFADGTINNDVCHSVFEGNLAYLNDNGISNTESLIGLNYGASLDFAYNTITDNLTDNVFSMQNSNNSTQSLFIYGSLFWNLATTVISEVGAGHQYSGNCFNVPNPQNLPNGFGNIISANAPGFEDPANNLYELTLFSPPIDYCGDESYTAYPHDIVGVPRGFAVVAPVLGYNDMGAYEFNNVNTNDVIFADYFE